MKLLVMSDVHFEFHRDRGREFVRSLVDASGVDAVVLAGDVMLASALPKALALFVEKFPRAKVVFVSGNHEFYHGSPRGVALALADAKALCGSRLVVLDCDVVEIAGRRVLGATLWFSKDPRAPKFRMNDFSAISGFEPWVYQENDRARKFFERELRLGDVVVTHHLPAPESIDARFFGDPINAFFVSDMRDLIADRRPALWIHGHTHLSQDYVLGETRIVCNPYGYVGFDLNAGFRADKVIET